MKFFAVLCALSTVAVGGAASAMVGTAGPDPKDTFGLRAVAPSVASAASALSHARRPPGGLAVVAAATGERAPALLPESPPPPSGTVAAEAAALFPLQGRGPRMLATEPCPGDVGHVDCVNGFVANPDGTQSLEKCSDACGGDTNENCCSGPEACRYFHGRVCKDGSCSGRWACKSMKAALVLNSCTANEACYGAGNGNGNEPIGGTINDSCHGYRSCWEVANLGRIHGDIINSCHGSHACARIAILSTGILNGDIRNSCHGLTACHSVAWGSLVNGTISDSCLAESACREIGYNKNRPFSHGLDGCCNTANECYGCQTSHGCNGYREEHLPQTCAKINTSSPTATPTQAPTTPAPTTPAPTSSPIKAPWEIEHTETEANFNSSNPNGIVQMKFLIGKERDYKESSFAGGCDPAEEGGTAIDPDVMATRTSVENSNSIMDELTVVKEFNKSLVAGSNIYDNETDTIRFCHEVELVQYINSSYYYVVQKQFTDVAIALNLTANFVVDVTLDAADVKEANATVNLDDFIFAIHCDGSEEMGELSANTKIKPNDDLDICVLSSSSDVEIDQIATMTIQGKKPDGSDSSLPVIAEGRPSIPAITYFRHQNATGVAVRTRVPTNAFGFELENAAIDVVGSVSLKLKGGRRRLADGAGPANRNLQAAAADEGVASFDLSVSIEPDESSAGDRFFATASSAKAAPGRGSPAALLAFLASAIAFVW